MNRSTLSALAIILATALVSSGCRRADWRDVAVEIPGLAKVAEDPKAYASARAKIEKALSVYDGVSRGGMTWDEKDKTLLTVRFDSLHVAEMNIRKSIEEAGYEVVYPELVKGAPAGYINARRPEAPPPATEGQ